jgi:hypothetical protein
MLQCFLPERGSHRALTHRTFKNILFGVAGSYSDVRGRYHS